MADEENEEMNGEENVNEVVEEEGETEEVTEHVEEEIVEGEEPEITHDNDESGEKEAEEAIEEDVEENAQSDQEEKEEVANDEAEEEEVESNSKEESPDEDDQDKVAKSDDEEFAGFGEEEIGSTKKVKRHQVLSSNESDASVENENEDEDKPKKKKHKSSHRRHKKHSKKKNEKENKGDDESKESAGESGEDGDEADDVEEVAQELEEIEQAPKSVENNSSIDDKEDEDEERPRKKEKEETDLQAVLNAQKAESKKRRRKNVDSEELNEMDNKIQAIIDEMKRVAGEDRTANEKSMITLAKIKMLPTVMNMLQKSDYHATMIEMGVLSAIAEWLAPLPDRSLPNIKIRTFLIDTLRDFGEINVDYLKSSGVGKAVMFLFKHPKEIKDNKKKLEKLINNWSRPIFSLDGNFKQLTKEERQERDLEHVQQIKRLNSSDTTNVDEILNAPDKSRHAKKNKTKEDHSDKSGSEESNKQLRPGDAGFCPRARVPIPSSKDYVVRPKSNMENMENVVTNKPKKSESRLDKHTKRFIELKKNGKTSRAVTMSISK